MEENKTIKFEANGDFITIRLINRPFPDADIDWDRDAIDAVVTVRAGVFGGEFSTTIWSHELTFLLTLLSAMDKTVGKETEETYRFREGTISLTFKMTRNGIIRMLCRVCENPFEDTALIFTIGADQSYLPYWIAQIVSALTDFPQILKVR